MQRYDFYLILPNFYTLFCYPEITFYTVDAHTGRKINNPEYDRKIFDESESAPLGIAAWIFGVFYPLPMHLKLRHDVAMATSGRTKDCVAM